MEKQQTDQQSILNAPGQPLAPQSGTWTDPARFVWRPERLDPQDREALEDSTLTQCHGQLRGVTGADCLACTHLVGIARYARTGDPFRDFRGVCAAPVARQHLVTPRLSAVSCPEAPAKVEGARRWDRVKTDHCRGCHWNTGDLETATRCAAPRGVRYVPLCVG